MDKTNLRSEGLSPRQLGRSPRQVAHRNGELRARAGRQLDRAVELRRKLLGE